MAAALSSLALPMLGGIFSVIAFNLADTYFVSQLGTRQLAAMSFTFPVVMVMLGIAFGLTTGTAAAVSRAIGRGETNTIRRLSADALTLAFLVVLIAATIGMLTIDPLFLLLGATPGLLPLIRDYMLIWYPGMVFLVIPMVANAAIRAGGDAKFPALIMSGGMIANIILDPLLIFGLFGLPRLELQGAAIASIIARAATMTASLLILHFRDRMIDWSPPSPKAVWQSWKTIGITALPAATTNLMNPVAVGIVTRLIAPYGAGAVAAWGAGSRVTMFILIPVYAVCSALMPFIGQNWGAGLYQRVNQARRYATVFAFFWGLAMLGLLWLIAEPIARLFNDDTTVVKEITLFLLIIPIGYCMAGVFQVAEDVLNAIGRPMVSAVQTTIYMFLLYVPLGYAGSEWMGLRGLLLGLVVADILAGFMGVGLMYVHANRTRS